MKERERFDRKFNRGPLENYAKSIKSDTAPLAWFRLNYYLSHKSCKVKEQRPPLKPLLRASLYSFGGSLPCCLDGKFWLCLLIGCSIQFNLQACGSASFFLYRVTSLMCQKIAKSSDGFLIRTQALFLLQENLRVGEMYKWVPMRQGLAQMLRISFQRELRPRNKHPRLHCSIRCLKIFSLIQRYPFVVTERDHCSGSCSDRHETDCGTNFQPQAQVLHQSRKSNRVGLQKLIAPSGPWLY